MKTKTLLFALSLLLLACQQKKETEAVSAILMDVNLADPPACASPPPVLESVNFVPPIIKDDSDEENTEPSTLQGSISKNKKIIKDGSISIKVKDVEKTKKRIDAIVKDHNGYYENESFDNSYSSSSYNLKVRIPTKQFDSFLNASEKGNGEITYKNINARDVSEEYVDGETRLNSKRLFRNRYNQLLDKATKVADIMVIEENIRALQEEIESAEGHLKFLDDQVNYSTLEINLFKEKEITKANSIKETFLSRTKTSIGNGWEALISFLLWNVMQWPWYILAVSLIIIIRRLLKKRKI